MAPNEPSTSRKGSFENVYDPINGFKSLLRQLTIHNQNLMLVQFQNYLCYQLPRIITDDIVSIHVRALVDHGIENVDLACFTKSWLKMFRECRSVKLKVLRTSLFTILEDRFDAVCTSKEISSTETYNLLQYTLRLQKFLTVPFHKTLVAKLITHMKNGRAHALKIFLTYIENLSLLTRLIEKRKLKRDQVKDIQNYLRLQLMENHPREINEQMARVINLLGSEEIFFDIEVNEGSDDDDYEEEELSEDYVFAEISSIVQSLKFIDINYALDFFNNFKILPSFRVDDFVRFYVDTALERREFKLYAMMAKKFDNISRKFSNNCNLKSKLCSLVLVDYQTKCKIELFTNMEKFSLLVEFIGELYNAELASIDEICALFRSFLSVIKSPLNLELMQLLLKTTSLQIIERNHSENLREISENLKLFGGQNLAELSIIFEDISETFEIIFKTSAKSEKEIFVIFPEILKNLTSENFNESVKEINSYKLDGNQNALEGLLKLFIETCFKYPENLENLMKFLTKLNLIKSNLEIAGNQIHMIILDHLTRAIEEKNHQTLLKIILQFHSLNHLNDSQILLFIEILLEQDTDTSTDGLFTILSSLGGHLEKNCKLQIFPKLAFIEFIAQSEDSYRAKVFKALSSLRKNIWEKTSCDTDELSINIDSIENSNAHDVIINIIWEQLMTSPETSEGVTKLVFEIFDKKNLEFNEKFWSFMELRRMTFTKASIHENLPPSFTPKLYATISLVVNLFEDGKCTESSLTDWIHPKLTAKLNSSQKFLIFSKLSSKSIKSSRLASFVSNLEPNFSDSSSTFSEIMKDLKEL